MKLPVLFWIPATISVVALMAAVGLHQEGPTVGFAISTVASFGGMVICR
jgi:hypothetical protein